MVQQENQTSVFVVYRRIDGLPVTLDKLTIRIPYIMALDRHGMWLAGLCHDP
jgi:hypothetical protein